MSLDESSSGNTQTKQLNGAVYTDAADRGFETDLGATDPSVVGDPFAAPGPYDAFDPFDSPGVFDPYAPADSFAGSGMGMQGTGAEEDSFGAAGDLSRPVPYPHPVPALRADGQGGYDYNSLYGDSSTAKVPCVRDASAVQRSSRQSAATSTDLPRPQRRGASAWRWVARLVCLGMLVFGIMAISSLTEQTVGETSSLSSSAQQLANKGAYLVETGQSPTRKEDPVKWLGERILLLSVKLSNHGVDIRHQAHTLQFALMGGVVALNVLAWMSGWAHARSSTGQIRSWRSLLMLVLSVAGCATVSLTDQYHKLYVPGRHFDNLDLVFDAAGYLPAVLLVFAVWSVGSSVYRLVFRK